jgi:hypothetical protein
MYIIVHYMAVISVIIVMCILVVEWLYNENINFLIANDAVSCRTCRYYPGREYIGWCGLHGTLKFHKQICQYWGSRDGGG